MGNTYFQFKQFRVEQGQCAMKVSTDACIFGAWTPVEAGINKVLDAGTGTGLLSLMLAQRFNGIEIDAIELDIKASEQAKQNFYASPWAARINIKKVDIRRYPFLQKYDMLICNPPFFQNSLLGDDESRNNARHTITLTYKDIIELMERVLNEEGYASILLPYSELEQWRTLLGDSKWYINKQLLIQPRADLKANRVITICSRQQETTKDENLLIYDAQNKYTTEAVKLLGPFYLNL